MQFQARRIAAVTETIAYSVYPQILVRAKGPWRETFEGALRDLEGFPKKQKVEGYGSNGELVEWEDDIPTNNDFIVVRP